MAGEPLLYGFLFEDCPSAWKVVPFPDAVDFQEGPGILAKDFHESGVPLLRLSGVQRSLATLDGCNFLDPDKVKAKWNHFRLRKGDLVISTSASIGMVSEIGDEVEGAVAYTGLIRLRPNRPDVWPGFIKQFARSSLFTTQAEGMAAGSVLRHFGPSHLRQMCFPIPPLPEQKRIAHILGALDNKIELNRRIKATLEGIPRAIFKSWFVDFDPVRQKAAGKQPLGMDAYTATLFPDSFEDSKIGQVPKGWRVLALPEVADIMSGGTPRKSNAAFWGGDIPWVSPKGMTHIHVDDSSDRVTEAAVGNGTRLVPAGAVLVMVRGMGLHDGVRVSQATCPVTFNQDVKALVAKGIPATHLLYWMLHESSSLLTKVQSSGHGTGVLPTEFLAKLTVVIPGSDDTLGRLVAYLEAFDAQHLALVTQGRTLAALRDSLLPKLLSGEIRVPEAEEAVEEALA